MAAATGQITATPAAVIGPNAITRLAEALALHEASDACQRVFGAAGLAHHLRQPPHAMVPDDDAARLHAALMRLLGPTRAATVSLTAGRLTAQYLLAHRIPLMAQRAIGLLPRRLALRALLMAISRHAWTFAGGGRFSWRAGRVYRLMLTGGPICRHLHAEAPACAYYAATFEHLFRRIISPALDVVETECEAMGHTACVFEVRLR
jgi:divinyl protochlorophyllide a 8-vinyl-reductase